jgi:hypothetical protein
MLHLTRLSNNTTFSAAEEDEFLIALENSTAVTDVFITTGSCTQYIYLWVNKYLTSIERNSRAKLHSLALHGVLFLADVGPTLALLTRIVLKHSSTLEAFYLNDNLPIFFPFINIRTQKTIHELISALIQSSITKLGWEVHRLNSNPTGDASCIEILLKGCKLLTSLIVGENNVDDRFCSAIATNTTLTEIVVIECNCKSETGYAMNWYALKHALSLNISVRLLDYARIRNYGCDKVFKSSENAYVQVKNIVEENVLNRADKEHRLKKWSYIKTLNKV